MKDEKASVIEQKYGQWGPPHLSNYHSHEIDFTQMSDIELLQFIYGKRNRRRPWRNIDRWEYRDALYELFCRLNTPIDRETIWEEL